jgi:ATP-dependent Clp protease adapter protein ClpS
MHDVSMPGIDADAKPLQLVFHNDDKTPMEFVFSLFRAVFGKAEKEPIHLFDP